MEDRIVIYGTNWWPHCTKAREAYGDRAVFIDVDADIKVLQKMLEYSGGKMTVPVIVEGSKVIIGSGGESGVGST